MSQSTIALIKSLGSNFAPTMFAAPLVTLVVSAMVTPRYVQRLIDELAHQQRKPLVPWALIFNTVMVVASTVLALPILTFGAACVSAFLTNHKLDFLGAPEWTTYSLNPLWATLGAGLVAAVAHKQYHTESDKIVIALAGLLNVAITVPAAPFANLASDAALKVTDGQPIQQSINQAIGAARYPSPALTATAVVLPLTLAIMILHILVADGVMRGHQAHEHWNEIKADDLIRDIDGNPIEDNTKNARTLDVSEQKIFDVITGRSMSLL